MIKAMSLSLLGLLMAAVGANAHPDFIPGTCHVLQRDKVRDRLDLDNAERLDFIAPALRIGDTTVSCTADLGAGPITFFSFANTGFTCDLGPEIKPIAKTRDWTEIIKANGQTTLTCRFGPRP